MRLSREASGYALGVIGVAIFAGTLPATRLAVATLHPWFVTFGRAAVAGILAGLLLLILRRPFPVKRLRPLFISGLMVLFGFPGFMALAMQTVPAAHGGVVLGLMPIMTAALGAWLNRERPGWRFWGLSMIGAGIVVGFASHAGGGGLEAGDLLLFAAALCGATGYVFAAEATQDMPGWEVISWTCFLFLPVTGLASLFFLPADIGAVSASSWWGFAYAALFSQFIGFFAWNAGLAIGGVTKISQVQLLQVFFTIAFAAVINREAVGADAIGAAVLVVLVLVAMRRARG